MRSMLGVAMSDKAILMVRSVVTDEAMRVLSAPTLRSLAPQSMNISASFPK